MIMSLYSITNPLKDHSENLILSNPKFLSSKISAFFADFLSQLA
ncbi:Hypothetical protein GbCGDNIH9_8500 [Granulibacter bethesdensis]|uniref:Uncharacterized protein n=1 Tax=Granulibacter bethesdensis TaxID=364410 RepID=A0AAC9KA14_9PROT|nr:Hypothetical protein GbCGDNIH9_8500 [Granulibacter bethesdensis]APH62004.1 Hypothetical protein GbCGDNIH8_8500 [Granulibacter bethesdensis]